MAPRHLLETGLVSALVLALASVSLAIAGLATDADAYWIGSNVKSLLFVFAGAVGLAIVPALFLSSLVALRMLEHAREASVASRLVARLPKPEPAADWRALEQPASVVEHTTIRLVVDASDTEKVHRHG